MGSLRAPDNSRTSSGDTRDDLRGHRSRRVREAPNVGPDTRQSGQSARDAWARIRPHLRLSAFVRFPCRERCAGIRAKSAVTS